VREQFPGSYAIDLLDESKFQALTANPGSLADELRELPRQKVVVLDEVQRVPALEGLIFMTMQAHNGNKRFFDEISYWSPAQARQTEVDFLLRQGKEYVAIEVKSQSRYAPNLLSGLRAIAELPQLKRRLLVYLGQQRLKTEDGIEVWPLETFLEAVAANRLWPD